MVLHVLISLAVLLVLMVFVQDVIHLNTKYILKVLLDVFVWMDTSSTILLCPMISPVLHVL